MRRAAAVVLVLAAAALGGGGSAQAGFPAGQGRLVVLTENFGFTAPSLLRDGQLSPFGLPLGIHGSVALSPDGTRAAMVGTVALFPGMAVPTLLFGDLIGGVEDLGLGTVAGRPAWSPDGRKLAFAGNRGGNWDIYVVALGEGAVPVDLTPASPAAYLEPRWSPDGTKIAFESDRSGTLDVFTMNGTAALSPTSRAGPHARRSATGHPIPAASSSRARSQATATSTSPHAPVGRRRG
jgi:hypothetical protein